MEDGDSKDPPIIGADFVSGVTVVDIGDLRVARGLSRRPFSSCKHPRQVYDPRERRIWCPDCEKNIDPFDAYIGLVENYDRAITKIRRERAELEAAQTFNVRSLAAKALDEAWRSRKMVPTCPQCGHGLFPEDFKNGISHSLGREYALALRKRNKK